MLTCMLLQAAGAKGRKAKGAKSAAVVTSGEEESEVERLMDEIDESQPARHSRPHASNRSPRIVDSEGSLTEPEDDIHFTAEVELPTPKARPRPKAYKAKSPVIAPNPTANPPTPSPAKSTLTVETGHEEINGFAEAAPSRKRGYSNLEDEAADDENIAGDSDNESAVSPPTELQIRKRVRH